MWGGLRLLIVVVCVGRGDVSQSFIFCDGRHLQHMRTRTCSKSCLHHARDSNKMRPGTIEAVAKIATAREEDLCQNEEHRNTSY